MQIIITVLAISITRVVYAILMLNFDVTNSNLYFAILGKELTFLILATVLVFGQKRVLEFMAKFLRMVLGCVIYFALIMLMMKNFSEPVLGQLGAGFLSTALILLPIIVFEIKLKLFS